MSGGILVRAGLVTAAVLGLSAGVHAQSREHIDSLARRLEQQAREVHREVHAHFRATPQFVHLDRDVTQMERLAEHIHDMVHRNSSVSHLRSDVRELDRLFHHVEQLVDEMARCRGLDRFAYSHLREDLSRMERTLHHLRSDLNELTDSRVIIYGSYRPGYGYRPAYPLPRW